MIVDVTEYVKFLTRHKIDANQFLFIYLLYKKEWKNIQRLRDADNLLFDPEDLQYLENIGMIQDMNKVGEHYADMYIVTDKIVSDLFMDTDIAAEEFFEEFPPFMYINGQKAPIRGVPKDLFLKKYLKYIRRNPNVHRKIMKAMHEQRESGAIKMRIDNWVFSEMWKLDDAQETGTSYGSREV